MYIRSLLKKGNGHELACQDSVFTNETEEFIFSAVFDGCSEVVDSHFASNLLNKTFKYSVEENITNRKNEINNFYLDEKNNYSIEKESAKILKSFFAKLNQVREVLNLSSNDFAATCIFLFYDKIFEEGVIYVFGDGVLLINEERIIIDHDNKPKYITYYWKELTESKESLYNFLISYDQVWKLNKIKNVVISTDGILTFKNNNNINEDILYSILEETKINDQEKIHQNFFLNKKYNILLKDGWSHYDDIGLVRIYNNE